MDQGKGLRVLSLVLAGIVGCLSDRSAGPSPRLVGSEICAGCHADHHTLWEYGGHSAVACETCHGPGGDHVRIDQEPRTKMSLNGKADLCLSCHGPEAERKSAAPMIESLDIHVQFVGEKHSVPTDAGKAEGKCTFCHDPHSLD